MFPPPVRSLFVSRRPARRAAAVLFFLLGLAGSPAGATPATETETESGFRVLDSGVGGSGERAEFCLTLSAPFDNDDRAALAASLRLEREGRRLPVPPESLSLTATDLCVQNLERRRLHRIFIRALRSREGVALPRAFSASFTPPDLPATLRFAIAPESGGAFRARLPRFSRSEKPGTEASPLGLQARNVQAANLHLFRFDDASLFGAAWQQARQADIAPSESLVFARAKGREVWQGELAPAPVPNRTQRIDVPLFAIADLAPGLYFLAATPPASGMEAATPAAMAGLWFTLDGPLLLATQDDRGLHVAVANPAKREATGRAKLALFAGDGQRRAVTDANDGGAGFLPIPRAERTQPLLLAAVDAEGGVGLLDPAQQPGWDTRPEGPDGFMATDRAAYRPGGVARVALRASDPSGALRPVANSFLKLVRPDQTFHSEIPVPEEKNGPVFLSFPLPMTHESGLWTLLWQRTDGLVLARSTLALGDFPLPATLALTTDRAATGADREITLTLKATDATGAPLAWRSGRVVWTPERPAPPGLKDYAFGLTATGSAAPPLPFVTDSEGRARIRAPIAQNGPHDAGQALAFVAKLDGLAEPARLLVPAATSSGGVTIGIRRAPDAQRFVENGQVRFHVVAADSNGRRRTPDAPLFYQIFEEERRFLWHTARGRWDYRLLPSHRRVAGGRLAFPANTASPALIEEPLRAGSYILEVADSEGAVRARFPFATSEESPPAEPRLTLEPSAEPALAGRETVLRVTLKEPAFLSLLQGQREGRVLRTAFLPAGTHALPFTPSAAEGAALEIQARALFADQTTEGAATLLPLRDPDREVDIDLAASTLADSPLPLAIPLALRAASKKNVVLQAFVAPETEADSLFDSPSSLLPIPVPGPEGRALLKTERPAGSPAALRVTVFGWNEKRFGVKTATLPVRAPLSLEGHPPLRLQPGDEATFTLRLRGASGTDGTWTFQWTSPSGVVVKGPRSVALRFGKGGAREVAFTLQATRETADPLRLDLRGPGGLALTRSWPFLVEGSSAVFASLQRHRLEPRQALALRAPPKSRGSILVVAPFVLPDLPRLWSGAARLAPASTKDRAERLAALLNERSALAAAGLFSETTLAAILRQETEALRRLQNEDGGFAALTPGQASDLEATAAALTALTTQAPEAAQQAALWLRRALENGWFEERERLPRAAAFLALAGTRRADLAALRYFAMTSADKDLPPLAQARLATALAQSGDEAAARPWFNKARTALAVRIEAKNPAAWELLDPLLATPFLTPDETASLLEAAASLPMDALAPGAGSLALSALRALGTAGAKLGGWTLEINGMERRINGVFAQALNERGPFGTLRNPALRPLYLTETALSPFPATANAANAARDDANGRRRAFYHLDGARVAPNETLTQGDVYALVVNGLGRVERDDEPMVLDPGLEQALTLLPLTDAAPEALKERFPWLPEGLVGWQAMEGGPTGLVALAPPDQPVPNGRVALLVKAGNAGRYVLPPARTGPAYTPLPVPEDGTGLALTIAPPR